MRTLFALLIAVPICAQEITVRIDTSDAAQLNSYDDIMARKSVLLAADALATKVELDSLTTHVDSTDLTSLGTVTVVADTRDSQWVQIDLPQSTATGFTKRFIVAAIASAKSNYGAKDSGVVGRVRMRKDLARQFLISLSADLQ